MNKTNPPHVQFIQKPVFAALGMLSNLAKYGSNLKYHYKDGHVISVATYADGVYSAIISWNSDVKSMGQSDILVDIHLSNLFNRDKLKHFKYFIEYMEANKTDPFAVWQQYQSPAYPNATVRHHMRMAEVSYNILHIDKK